MNGYMTEFLKEARFLVLLIELVMDRISNIMVVAFILLCQLQALINNK